MNLLSRKQKDLIKGQVVGSIFEKPFYKLKQMYDLLVMNKWGKNYLYDKQTAELISKLPADSNCIDIGCHKGDILKAIVEHSPRGKHFAFEPIPELYDNLIEKFKSVKIFQLALSTQKGKTKFYNVVSGQGVSGLKKRNYDREHEIIEIDVEIDTLDNVIPKDVKIDFIKIDVEGGEFDVMKGGRNIIEKYKPIIIFEFEKEAAEKYNISANDVYNFFNKEMSMQLGLMKSWLGNKTKSGFSEEEFIHLFNTGEEFYFIAYAV